MSDLIDSSRKWAATLAVFGILCAPDAALSQGKIVCWKDASGKVLGCGDKVPPEFQTNATKELDRRGVTRKTTESQDEITQRRNREQEATRLKAEDSRKVIDQKRQDTALLETFSSEKEIDLKRDRDLQVIDLQMEQLNTALKSAAARYTDTKTRSDSVLKTGKEPSPTLKEDLARAIEEKGHLEQRIEAKQKEKEELRKRYAEYRKRYADLRSGASLPGQMPVATK